MSKPQEMLAKAAKLSPQIIALRRQFHAAPELSFQEIKTALLAKEHLEKLGFTVRTGIAKTGLVADLGAGKTVAIRSDMDALPGFESNRTNYVSKNPGAMHACGHDAHIAIVLAAAQLVAELKPPQRLRIILQPGTEESERDGNLSAKLMIEAGVLTDVSALLGLHVDATIASGQAGIIATQLNSQISLFRIQISAFQENRKRQDALPKASSVMTGIYKLASEFANRGKATIALGSCISSSQRGHIPSQHVALSGTISSTTPEAQREAVQFIEQLVAKESSDDFGLALEFQQADASTAQSTGIIETMRRAAVDLLGESNVFSINRKTWASDFALLASAAPAAFVYLGAELSGSRRIHHQPSFDLDESGLHLGAAILALTAIRLMED